MSPQPDDWQEVVAYQSFTAETHTVELAADAPFLLDSVTVYDRSAAHLTPLLAVVGVLGVLALLGIVVTLWQRYS